MLALTHLDANGPMTSSQSLSPLPPRILSLAPSLLDSAAPCQLSCRCSPGTVSVVSIPNICAPHLEMSPHVPACSCRPPFQRSNWTRMATPSQKMRESKNRPEGSPQLRSHTLRFFGPSPLLITDLRTSWLNTWTLNIAPQPHLPRLTAPCVTLDGVAVTVVLSPLTCLLPSPSCILLHTLSIPVLPTYACLSLSSILAFSWTVLYAIYSGLLKVQPPSPPSSFIATPFSTLCLPALICHSFIITGRPPRLWTSRLMFYFFHPDLPDILLSTPWATYVVFSVAPQSLVV